MPVHGEHNYQAVLLYQFSESLSLNLSHPPAEIYKLTAKILVNCVKQNLHHNFVITI